MAPRTSSLVASLLGAALAAGSTALGQPPGEARATRLPPVPLADLQLPHRDLRDGSPRDELSPERLARGYTIIVVGVNGNNVLSAGLAPGLVEGGYPGAVDVVDWTTGLWPLFLYHLRADGRHTTAAHAIAEKISAYRAQYPGREVNLIGFSAGADVVLDTLHELSESEPVDRVVLLAAAVSPVRDLRESLTRCRIGLWNYYQPQDVVALWAGTVLAGTADGVHLVSAGAVGFWSPLQQHDADEASARHKLVQLPYDPRMALSGNLGGHFQCVNRHFIARWIAPVLTLPVAVRPQPTPGGR
jgi:hypothetical protein